MNSTLFDLSTYLKDLEYLVNIDSGSSCPEGTTQVAEFFHQKFVAMEWQVRTHNFDSAIGPCLEIVNTDQKHYDVLLMGHMDTVFKTGTVAERPFTVEEDKAFGPGVNDMKAGLLSIYYALNTLQHERELNQTAVCIAFNSDEELGSIFSRPWLEELSKKSQYVLVLEAARSNGNLVNQRKGIGRYKIELAGVAAHSGVDPEKGCSAIQELAHWILALHNKTNYETGTTVNVGVISGGTTVNVVPDQAKAEVDLRICDLVEVEAIENVMHELVAHPRTSGVTAKVMGGITRPPMNPSEKTLQLCKKVEIIGCELGIDIGWAATGGGSDGSFAAILGVPTIDGLGPVGGGSHGISEYILISSIEPRFQLLRRIIQEITAN